MPTGDWPSRSSPPSVPPRPAPRPISRDDGRLLVEFHTPGRGLLGRPKLHRTVEWVPLHEPHRVEFDTVEGPFSMMHDRFILE
jgi:hypothetical protein